MLVLAGPGSGKTFVMIRRLEYLIRERQIDPSKILLISFSKASTIELKQRFEKLSNTNQNQVTFSTFHALFFHILKQTYSYTTKDILTEVEKHQIIKTILNNPLYEEEATGENEEKWLSIFAYYKNKNDVPKEVKTKQNAILKFQQLYQAYEEEKRAMGKLDFDDMATLTYALLQKREDLRKLWQERFSFICIDEFQDINPIQFQIIRLLAYPRNNLFVVGDDDQAIYGFRGSSPEIMLGFKKYYPTAKEVLLETNFRCQETIVKAGIKVIAENKQRFHKEIVANKSGGVPVELKGFPNTAEEYQWILSKMLEERRKNKALNWSDFACIFRTNTQMMALAEFLIRHRIPIVMKERVKSIFQSEEGKELRAYLRYFLAGHNRKDFVQIMNKPVRYIHRNALQNDIVSIEELKNYYQDKPFMKEKLELLRIQDSRISRLDPYSACMYIRKVVGYEKDAIERGKKEGKMTIDIEERIAYIQESLRGFSTLEQWESMIEELEKNIQNEGNEEGIQFITMHGSKGLEYEQVFLPDCNEGKVPNKQAVTESELEEERRMFYVAMTRAKSVLSISYLEGDKKISPSRFLNPLIRKKLGDKWKMKGFIRK